MTYGGHSGNRLTGTARRAVGDPMGLRGGALLSMRPA
jgi:hypothetical protein